MMNYYRAASDEVKRIGVLPENALPLLQGIPQVMPPQISDLHRSLAQWSKLGLSPGEVLPNRIWVDQDYALYFGFRNGSTPKPLMQTGLGLELASWLVLLTNWMETFVVIARARAIWSPNELAGALTFMTPAFLPPVVSQLNPDWDRVAIALATAIADGPLSGSPTDSHWQGT